MCWYDTPWVGDARRISKGERSLNLFVVGHWTSNPRPMGGGWRWARDVSEKKESLGDSGSPS
jgi:hypothetical protein